MEPIDFLIVLEDSEHFAIGDAEGHEFVFGRIEWNNKPDELVLTVRWNGPKPFNSGDLIEAALTFTRLRGPWRQT